MRVMSIVIASLFFLNFGYADTLKKTISLPHLNNFKFYGYLDGSYNYLVRSNKFTSGTFNRVYDITENGFTLQQASMTLAYQPQEGLGGLINPIVGHDTYIFSPYGWDPYYGSQWLGFDIPQAYLQFSLNKFTMMGGELFTLASIESVDPTKSTNFSRSILWGYATPTTTLGLRGRYLVDETLTVIGGINDGWDTIRDVSRHKTIELSVVYAPRANFSTITTLYSGGERAADKTASGPQSIRSLLDIVAILNVTDKLALALNYDYGIQTKAALPSGNIAEAVWQGVAGYFNYKFNDKWRSSVRGEIFSDRNGYRTGVVQSWKELTLTFGYFPLKQLEIRMETRHDFSNMDSFVNARGGSSNNNQQSYAVEGLYQF